MQSDKATTKARKPTKITKRILCTKPSSRSSLSFVFSWLRTRWTVNA